MSSRASTGPGTKPEIEVVPSDGQWYRGRIKDICRLQYGDALPVDVRRPGDVPVYGSNGVIGRHRIPNTTGPSVIIGRKGSAGAVSFSESPAFVIDTAYFVDQKSARADLRWIYYTLESQRLEAMAQSAALPGLTRDDVYGQQIHIPPLPVQLFIAAFLDRATGAIDEAIAAKKRLLELLEEERLATVFDYVTKGANSRNLVSSGVDWAPAFPAHWEVVRLGSVLRERGATNTQLREQQVLSLVRGRGVIPYEEKGAIGNRKSEDISRYKLVKQGDLVLNSMNVIIGSVGIAPMDGCLSPVYYVLTTRSEHDSSDYFGALFDLPPFHQGLVRWGNGILAHRMRIPMERLKSVLIPRPPADEQRAIVNALQDATAPTEKMIGVTKRQIELLAEYRTVLIADAVTGKLDLSAADSRHPDTVAEESVEAALAGEAP